MNLKECSYFIAIAEEQSLSRAAERLYMAQSSLSQFLSTLEAELGARLFIRTSKGVRITDAGRLLLDFSYKTLSSLHTMEEEMQDLGTLQRGRVIVGISSFRGSYLLPPVLKAFHLDYPQINIEFVEENSMELEQRLVKGDIDLALLVLPATDSRISAKFVMKDEICLISNADHPVMQHVHPNPAGAASQIPQCIDLRDAMDYEFVLSDYDTILGREARHLFSCINRTPITYNEKLSALFAAALGAHGQGLAFTYYSSRHYFRHAEFISLGEEAPSVNLGIALSPGHYHSKATLAFAEVLETVLKKEVTF